jgi:hypothetical protein
MPAELQKLLVLFSQRVTSQSAHYIRPGGMTPPKPPAGPVVTWNGHSPFSDSRHDLETAVPPSRTKATDCSLYSRVNARRVEPISRSPDESGS